MVDWICTLPFAQFSTIGSRGASEINPCQVVQNDEFIFHLIPYFVADMVFDQKLGV